MGLLRSLSSPLEGLFGQREEERRFGQRSPLSPSPASPTFRSPERYEPPEEPEQVTQNPMESYMSRYRQIMAEPSPALDAYRQHTANTPNRSDYKPSIWRTIGASIAGAGAGFSNPEAGVAIGTGIAEQPYRRAVEDYDYRTQTLGSQAEFEADERKQKIQAIKDAMSNAREESKFGLEQDKFNLSQQQFGLEQEKLGETRRTNDSLIDLRGAQTRKLDTPDYELKENADGSWTAIAKTPGADGSFHTQNIAGNSARAAELRLRADSNKLGWRNAELREEEGIDRNENARKDRKVRWAGVQARAQGRESVPSPSAQSTARESAAKRLIAENPLYKEFVDSEGAVAPQPTDPAKRKLWRRFMNQVEDYADRINTGQRFNYDEDEEDFELEDENGNPIPFGK